MNDISAKLEKLLTSYQDPYLNQDYPSLAAVQSLDIKGENAHLVLSLPYPVRIARRRIEKELAEHFGKEGAKLQLELVQNIPQFNPRPQTQQLAEVRNIIAIASGKGGVGKSTVSLNIARALSDYGARVGILDADIYGPSQPHLLNATPNRAKLASGKQLNPVPAGDLQTMSLSYLLEDKQTPTIWRGAMASNAIQQLLYSTKWDRLDYLVIDLPPGTGDIQLTLCQRASLSGAIIVSTPHQLALLGAAKGVEMFRRLYVPVLGMVENMSYYLCSECSKKHYVFGEKGTATLAAKMNTPLLTELPLTADCHLEPQQQSPAMKEMWQQLAVDIALQLSRMKIALPPEVKVVND